MNKTIFQTSALALAAAALAGCTTYVGKRLPADGKLATTDITGLPFNLTKPQYSVDIAPDANDATKAVYTLKSTDVTDSTQRYTLALDPALLVDGTFEFTYGDQGNITSATATSTSRVIATLEAAVSFAINRAASIAAKDMGTVLSQYRNSLRKSDADECMLKVKFKEKDEKGKLTESERSVAFDIDAEFTRLVAEAKREQAGGDEATVEARAATLAASRFHYANNAQRACLVAVAPNGAKGMDSILKTQQKAYDDKLGESRGLALSKKDAVASYGIGTVDAAVQKKDVGTIKKLADATVPQPVKDLTGPAQKLVEAKLDAEKIKDMSNLFAFMSTDVWRSRHLQYLERQIAQHRLDDLMAGKIQDKDVVIAGLEKEWAQTLGEPRVIERIAELDKFLVEVKVVPGSIGNAPRYAAAEFVQLREERDRLQDRIDKLRADLVGKNRELEAPVAAKKVEPKTDIQVALVKRSFIEAVAANPGGYRDEDLPPFVLVLERDERPALTDLPALPPPPAPASSAASAASPAAKGEKQ